MAITYTVGEYTASDSSVQVLYTNEEGFEHKRHVNIPKNPDGTIDEEYFAEILEGQLRGVENKLRVGAVTFTDPTPPPTPEEVEVPAEETTEPALEE
jgi:hypothetical protein